MGLSINELTEAIRQNIDENMEPLVAEQMAEHALGFFGYYDRIIDNALEPTDRNLFYMFQDYELLTTESEETTLWDGREWRIHYWKFKEGLREKVLAKMSETEEEEETDPYADLYTDISDRIWRHGEDNSAPKGAFSKII
ncbi:MAG: DUF6015 family protein [Candidatus Thermoplasmatota archaeon]|nr:DUF6015 family protein [Candidatus Thermoplasmatota archaeon]MED5485547.1 DUF6015 family protein [Candidatus Thermoplasmatota archaeon]|tara:strand:+ start:567 stop:986 length:420 start_codon:yes stop_codon:yes gene_type:complete